MDDAIIEKVKQVEYEILCQVDAFCKRNGIRYSLYGGTLLGAVRHGGFIPWDDDIDIVMTREEFTRFCALWQSSGINGYYLEYFELDTHTQNCHAKIRKNGTLLLSRGEDESAGHHGIWIDIFILDKISGDKIQAEKTISEGRKMLILVKANALVPGESTAKKLVRRILRLLPSRMRWNVLHDCAEYMRRNDAELTDDYLLCDFCTLSYMKVRYPKHTVDSYTELRFCEKEFPAFSNYEELLTIMYGDYMQLPPEEERVYKHTPVKIQL